LRNGDDNHSNSAALWNGLGIQLLAYSGWRYDAISNVWKKPNPSDRPNNIQERLKRITPTWKGGPLDYASLLSSSNSVFFANDNNHPSPPTITTYEDLVEALESMGWDYPTEVSDPESQEALQTMLSWNIALPSSTNPISNNNAAEEQSFLLPWGHEPRRNVSLLIFSFGEAPSSSSSSTSSTSWGPCTNNTTTTIVPCLDHSPVGPTNELLAATAAQFWNAHHHATTTILAQWEVAMALHQRYGIPSVSIGTPGVYSNTADILHRMQSYLSLSSSSSKIQSSSSSSSTQPPVLLLLAHPDHLRRVLWTAQTILSSSSSFATPNQPTGRKQYLRNKNPQQSSSIVPIIHTAMQPYHWSWPRNSRLRSAESQPTYINLYNQVQATVITRNGPRLHTSWYDDNDDDDSSRFGYFVDNGENQPWTHNREIWKLYDHWAVLKGIVTGTIDVSKILSL
jgi:hypothetical protein